MRVRIEDQNGTVLEDREAFDSDTSESVMAAYSDTFDFCQVDWKAELNCCYDYCVVFYEDADEDTSESILSTAGFRLVDTY